MEKYYDEFATNCEGCGWLKTGEYLDGLPYLSCIWYGTIMTKQGDAECKARKTPEFVENYFAKQRKEEEKRNQLSRATRKKRDIAAALTWHNEDND